jgi:hypothetical protein
MFGGRYEIMIFAAFDADMDILPLVYLLLRRVILCVLG